ncbi:hypothetical protein [Qipengyuania sp. MTN3-11]
MSAIGRRSTRITRASRSQFFKPMVRRVMAKPRASAYAKAMEEDVA